MKRVPRTLILLLLAGALLRILLIEVRPPGALERAPDEQEYLALARNIAHGSGFSLNGEFTAYRDMFYPALAGRIMAFAGDSPRPMLYLQVLLSCATAFLLFRITSRRFPEEAAVWTAGVWLFYPAAALASALFLTATLFVFFVVLSLECYDRLVAGGFRAADALWLGVAAGLTVLTRAVGLVLLVALLLRLVTLRYGPYAATHWKSAVLLVAACAALCVPWMARNAARVGSFTLNTNGGFDFVGGAALHHALTMPVHTPREETGALRRIGDVPLLSQTATPGVSTEDDDGILALWSGKFARIWTTDIGLWTHYLLPRNPLLFLQWLRSLSFMPLMLAAVPYMLTVALGLAGFLLAPAFADRFLIVSIYVLTLLAVLLTYGVPRDHFLFMPALLIGAAAARRPGLWSLAGPGRRGLYLLVMALFAGKWIYIGLTLTHL